MARPPPDTLRPRDRHPPSAPSLNPPSDTLHLLHCLLSMHFSRRGGRADDIKASVAEGATPLSLEGPGVTSLKESGRTRTPFNHPLSKWACLSIYISGFARPLSFGPCACARVCTSTSRPSSCDKERNRDARTCPLCMQMGPPAKGEGRPEGRGA